MGMVAILVMWPGRFGQTFVPPSQEGSTWIFGFNWPSGFWGEDVWKCWHTHIHTYPHMDDRACLYYKLTLWAYRLRCLGSGELIIIITKMSLFYDEHTVGTYNQSSLRSTNFVSINIYTKLNYIIFTKYVNADIHNTFFNTIYLFATSNDHVALSLFQWLYLLFKCVKASYTSYRFWEVVPYFRPRVRQCFTEYF